MNKKTIVLRIGAGKEILLNFYKNNLQWVCTASDEFMSDLCKHYPHLVKGEQKPVFKVGDRVRAKQTAGFHKGATGTIQYIEPTSNIWVRRDDSSSDVWYRSEELELLPVYTNTTI